MRRWWILIALLLSLGVNVGILTTVVVQKVTQPPAEPLRPPNGNGRPNFEMLADRLGTKGAQREKFIGIQERFFAATRESRQQLETLHGEMRRELTAEHPDRAHVDRILEELGRSYAAFDGALVENILQSREILGPAQQRQFLRVVAAKLYQLRFDRPAPPPAANRPFLRRLFGGGPANNRPGAGRPMDGRPGDNRPPGEGAPPPPPDGGQEPPPSPR